MASLSGYIAILIALFALCLGIAAVAKKNEIFSYVESHQSNLGISDYQLETFEGWYQALAACMFFICFLQWFRFYLSVMIRAAATRLDTEHYYMLAEEDRLYEESLRANQAARESKYDGLRSHYRDKYINSTDTRSGTESSKIRELLKGAHGAQSAEWWE